MDKDEYKRIDENADSHFWYVGTRDLLEKNIRLYGRKKNLLILDAGCGPGANFSVLKKFGNVFGIDNSKTAVELAKKRGENAIVGNLLKLPYKNNYFDLIVCADVLYHKNIKYPETAVKEFYRVLKNNGLFFSREPAFELLRRSHDQIVHTGRRFTKAEYLKLIKPSGFKTIRISYLNFVFLFLILIRKIAEEVITSIPKSDVKLPSKSLNKILLQVMKLENTLLKRINFPLGSSVFFIGQK